LIHEYAIHAKEQASHEPHLHQLNRLALADTKAG
jgi:hypothetical protein